MTALIFDMDGVIVDSNAMHRESWVAFNRRYGLETTEEMHQFMYGKRNDQIVRDFYGDGITVEEVDARGRAKERLYREMMAGRTEEMLVPGLRAFLERHRDLPMGVGSNAEPENVAYVLDEDGGFEKRCNLSMVELEPVPAEVAASETGEVESHGRVHFNHLNQTDEQALREQIEKHLRYTNSPRAKHILDNWSTYLHKFTKVMPTEYRRALEMAAQQVKQKEAA